MKRRILTVLTAAGLLMTRGGAEEAIDPERMANSVALKEIEVKNLGIETVEAEEVDFEETVFCLGRIEVLPGNRAVVGSRVPGRAQSVLALPDMKCEAGDELVWVESRQPGDPPPVVRLDAPIAGTIAKVNVAPGQPVAPEDSLIEIYDLSTVEAAAAVPEHLVGKLEKGQKARVRAPAFPDKVFEAELAHLGAEADAEKGTLEAAFHVENPDDLLRPGMRVEFSIVVGRREGVSCVPREAVQGDPPSRFVFVEDFELKNVFVKTPVETGATNDRYVEIVSGLFPGDRVVTRGAYALAFAGGGSVSLKEALDAAHGHEHNEDGSEMTPEQKRARELARAGHDHDEDSGGGRFWKGVSAALFLLLVLTLVVKGRGGDGTDEPRDEGAKPEDARPC